MRSAAAAFVTGDGGGFPPVSVDFATTNGNPSMSRTAGTFPDMADWSGYWWFKIPAYPGNFGEVLFIGPAVGGAGHEVEAATTSSYIFRATPDEFENLWVDGFTGWAKMLVVSDASGLHSSYLRAGGGWVDLPSLTDFTGAGSVARFFLCTFPGLETFIDVGVRYGVMELLRTSRPGGTTTTAEARAALKVAANTRGLSFPGDGLFYNPFISANCNIDLSDLGENLTLLGTPTVVADPPLF